MGFLRDITTKIGIDVASAYHRISFLSINEDTGEVYVRVKAYKSRAKSKEANPTVLDEQFIEMQGEPGASIISSKKNIKEAVYLKIAELPEYAGNTPVLEEDKV